MQFFWQLKLCPDLMQSLILSDIFWQWVKSVDSGLTHGREKSVRIDIIIEKNLKKQIRIPEGMTLSAG